MVDTPETVTYDQAGKPVEIQLAPAEVRRGEYVSVDKFDLPSSASSGQTLTFSAVGRVIKTLPYPIFGVAFGYLDGPVDSVTLIINGIEETLTKGYGRRYLTFDSVGDVIGIGVYGKLTQPGKYTFTARTYYTTISDSTVYIHLDGITDKEIEITAPTAPTAPKEGYEQLTKMLQEQLMPMMMSMMMLMMMMSMLSSMMASMREAFKKE